MMKFKLLLSCSFVCLVLVVSCAADAQGTTATAVAVEADAADVNINTFFRKEDNVTATDASTEENIPGLAATDYKKEWRAIPNLEHWSPFITSVVPFLPNMKIMALAMGWHYPMAWPLAGASGDHKDWLNTAFSVYGRAFIGRGPRPLVYPTILIPTPAAYKKLAADMKQHSGLPDLATVHDPAKKALMAAAIYQQVLSNLMVVATPLLSKAENGTVMMTQGKVKLTLLIKPDGSRHLVSNTTSLKLVAVDVGCEKCGPLTVQLVDSFVIPKMSPTPPRPDPLVTHEELAKWPDYMKMVVEGYTKGPKAMWDMPGAMWGMAVRQLPDSHQALLKKLPRMPRVPRLFAIDVKVREP